MAKNKPTKQHYVPACYLREFVDPSDGLLWVFSKDGKSVQRRSLVHHAMSALRENNQVRNYKENRD